MIASDATLADFATASTKAITELSKDATTKGFIDQIQAIKDAPPTGTRPARRCPRAACRPADSRHLTITNEAAVRTRLPDARGRATVRRIRLAPVTTIVAAPAPAPARSAHLRLAGALQRLAGVLPSSTPRRPLGSPGSWWSSAALVVLSLIRAGNVFTRQVLGFSIFGAPSSPASPSCG